MGSSSLSHRLVAIQFMSQLDQQSHVDVSCGSMLTIKCKWPCWSLDVLSNTQLPEAAPLCLFCVRVDVPGHRQFMCVTDFACLGSEILPGESLKLLIHSPNKANPVAGSLPHSPAVRAGRSDVKKKNRSLWPNNRFGGKMGDTNCYFPQVMKNTPLH